MPEWLPLTKLSDIDHLVVESDQEQVLIFKHSTRCSISSIVLMRLENQASGHHKITAYILDVLAHRDISDELARRFAVRHESPQLLILSNGHCIHHTSHLDIHWPESG